MQRSNDSARARGRGHYDRRATREQRWAGQHALLLAATAEVIERSGEARTASRIVMRAGVGPNTFYEHFRNVDDAITEVCLHAEEEIERAVEEASGGARTPVERLRLLCRAWCAAIVEHRAQALVLLDVRDRVNDEGLTRAGALFASLLRATLAAARGTAALSVESDPRRVAAISAAVENASLLALRDGADAAPLLTDLVVRAFR